MGKTTDPKMIRARDAQKELRDIGAEFTSDGTRVSLNGRSTRWPCHKEFDRPLWRKLRGELGINSAYVPAG